ncbi:MAG: hypothetical protein EBZ77_08605 [Chitinophagia bacterium]|nr:hypothetical protein [Chitinophagia bacterium]
MKSSHLYRKTGGTLTALAMSALLLQGCAAMFSTRYQKVTVQSSTPDAKIIYPNYGVKNDGGIRKYDRMKVYHTVRVEKEGYKSANYSFQNKKRVRAFGVGIFFDILVPYYGWIYGLPLDLASPRTRRFDPIVRTPALTPYPKRTPEEKYMYINNTAIDAKGKDLLWHEYVGINNYMQGKMNDRRATRKMNRSGDREDLKVDNTIFTSALNRTVREMGFTDSTIFPAIANTIYLDAKVKKITIHDVSTASSRSKRYYQGQQENMPNDLMSISLEIEWQVLDYYKQPIYTTTTSDISDLFTYNFYTNHYSFSEFVEKAMGDNLEYSLLQVRKQLSEKGYLKINNNAKETVMEAITLPKPMVPADAKMNDFMKAGVTIKVDEGHGSGVIVSADGYIVTAYHVVAGSKSIEVVLNDGTKANATLVRKSDEADLALLKIEKTGLQPLLLLNDNNPEIGVDVWTIGTPKSVELGQSVSKGILSGSRKANGVSYLQTDASVNGGNSGGALVNKNGNVIGIVTMKLVGVGTEGVGFAIQASEIFNKLKINYQQ